MFLFFVSACALISCVILIIFLKFSTDKQSQQQQNTQTPIDALTFLKSVRSTKPFPISSAYGWKIYSVCNDTRVWKRNLIVDNSGNRIDVIGCYVKLHASVQVVTKTLKDVTRFVEWRPGVESTTQSANGPDKQYGSVSHDFIHLITANQRQSTYKVVVEQRNIERYWKRENNGCFWMLESGDTGLMFYILQPVEEPESCCLTIVSHFTFPVTLQDSAVTISSYAQSMRDYMLYRKMKVTPLLDFHIPQTKVFVTSDKSVRAINMEEKPIGLSSAINDLSDSFVYSSSDSETAFDNTLAGMDPLEKSMILEKSANILHHGSRDQRLRSLSDTNTSDEKKNIVKHRSSTLPQDKMSASHHRYDTTKSKINQKGNFNDKKTDINKSEINDDDVFNESRSSVDFDTQNDSSNLPKINAQPSVISNDFTLPCNNGAYFIEENTPFTNVVHHVHDSHAQNSSSIPNTINTRTVTNNGSHTSQSNSTEKSSDDDDDEDDDDLVSQSISVDQKIKPYKLTQMSSPADIRFITLANQCAADLLAEYLRVSNIDLKKPPTQQAATSGGWAFYGLENDVVILKRTPTDGSSVVSYMGKGLIQASPQTVLETVKNPRTKFTYDETLKKVDILNELTDKIKIVYFYHEVINMFKKYCQDFCILQSERQDGDKLVLAISSVDTGLPVPVGVQRVKMNPSGWVIEPVQRDKKTYSMATYVIQVDFGKPPSSLDNLPVEELVSKQALGIASLRQFLQPAKWISRQQSTPSPKRLQSSPAPKQQSSQDTRHHSSSDLKKQFSVTKQQHSTVTRLQSSPIN